MPETREAAVQPEHPQKDQITRAMATMVFAMLFVPIMDGLSKLLSTHHDISPAMITWFRFLGQSVLLFMIIPFAFGTTRLNSQFKALNLLRGFLIGVAVTLFFVAIKYLPLADAIAIFFVEPLILMLMSAIFLRETVGWRRIVAAVFGFAGAMLVIQPSYAEFGLVTLLPLGTATLFATYLILSRSVGTKEHPFVMQLWSGIGGVLICSLIIFMGEMAGEEDFTMTMPQSSLSVLYLIGIIIIATLSHLLIVIAFSKAPASILAPFQYLEIITMTMLGYWLFGDFPSLIKWIGIIMIVASGAYIFHREHINEKSA